MNIQYDKEADAMYIYLQKAKVAKTIEFHEDLIVDVDSNGLLIGIEILNASSNVSKQYLNRPNNKVLVETVA